MDLTSGVKQAADELVPIFKSILNKIPSDIKGTIQDELDGAYKQLDKMEVAGIEAAKNLENDTLTRTEKLASRLEKLVERFDGATVTLNLKKGEI